MKKIIKNIYWVLIIFGNTIINKIPIRRLRRGYYRLLGANLTNTSVIFRKTDILSPRKLVMGKSSSVGWNVFLDARGGIKIGDNVTVASYCKLITGSHDINDSMFKAHFEPIIIEDYAWICTGAMILQGITIGRGSVVCAGAIVTKDVPPMSVVGGAPARIVKEREVEPVFHDDMKWSWLH